MKRDSAIQALDEFFAVIRARADRDPEFAAELLIALGVPVEVTINPSEDLKSKMLHLDPYILAKDGYDTFRSVFRPLSDKQLRDVIKRYNVAALATGKDAPKGEALIDILWEGAQSKRRRAGV